MGKPIDFSVGFTGAVADNQKVWEHDRSQTVGASEVFRCLRSTYLDKRFPELADEPEEDDEEQWGHTERGNLIENHFAVPSLQAMFGKDKCVYMGDEQRTFVDGRLSATPDGVVVDLPENALELYGVPSIGSSGCIATEIKTFGGEFAAPAKTKTEDGKVIYKPKNWHRGQNIVQMGLLRRKTNYQPDYGTVLYINPVNLKDIRPAAVKYEDGVYQQAKIRADIVFDPAKKPEDIPPEGLVTKKDCAYCKFVKACSDIQSKRFSGKAVPTKTLDPVVQQKLEVATKTVVELRAKAKELDAEKTQAEFDLKELMLEVGTNKASGTGWSVSLSEQAGRKSLDKDAIVEDTGINLEDYEKQGNPYFVLRAKAVD